MPLYIRETNKIINIKKINKTILFFYSIYIYIYTDLSSLIDFFYKSGSYIFKLICFRKKYEPNIFIKQIRSNETLSR